MWEEFTTAAGSRKQELAQTRQICFYFGYVFFKSTSYREMAEVFKKDHSTVTHSVSVVQHDMKVNGVFKRKIEAYHERIEKALRNSNLPVDQADKILDDTNRTISSMRIIAETYCRLTGKRMVDI